MKKIAPAVGILGAVLMATGFLLKENNISGEYLILFFGVLLLFTIFFPWLLRTKWKDMNPMQRTEPVLGILGTALLLSGFLFKNLHWPSGGIQIMLSVFLLNLGFLPLQLHLGWREGKTWLQKTYVLVRFAALFTVLLGFIFKMMHWPGAGLGLYAGAIAMPVYLVFYFILRFRSQGSLPFITRDLIICILAYGIWSIFNTMQVSESSMGGFRLLEDQYVKNNTLLQSSNRTIYESIDSLSLPGDDPLMISLKEIEALGHNCIGELDSIRSEFFSSLIQWRYDRDLPHLYVANDQLASRDAVAEFFILEGKGLAIKQLMNRYREGLHVIAERHSIPEGTLGTGLKTDDVLAVNKRYQDWVLYVFENVPAGSVMVNLSMIKQMLLFNEYRALNALTSQMDLSKEALMIQELAAREAEKAVKEKENEINMVKQRQELQAAQLEAAQIAEKQNRIVAIAAFMGVVLALILFSISTRAFLRKQRDNKKLEEQKKKISDANDELNQQNEEIAAQRDEIEAQRNLLFDQKSQIEKTHEEISSSIDYATRLQTSILPNDELLQDKLDDHFILFLPKDKVSGDFYWWTEVENHLIITAADCTGHGVPGAFMSMLGVSLLRETVNREFMTKPDIILRRLRKEVISSLKQKGNSGEQKDGMDMALISIDPGSRQCEFAGANNPLYHVSGGVLTEYKGDRMPISYYDRMDKFTSHKVPLLKGDMLYLFSDGYADQFGGPRRKKFMYRALKELLTEISDEKAGRQKEILESRFREWKGDYDQIDDVVVLGLRF